MRKIDKLINLQKANLLTEQIYLANKEGVNEDWKKNIAAGTLSALGSLGMGHAQTKVPDKQGIENSQSTIDNVSPIHHTLPIVDVQFGVQAGKLGTDAIYIYHKNKNMGDFNPETDRTTVYSKNLDMLHDTPEWQDYERRLRLAGKRGGYVPLDDESKQLEKVLRNAQHQNNQ